MEDREHYSLLIPTGEPGRSAALGVYQQLSAGAYKPTEIGLLRPPTPYPFINVAEFKRVTRLAELLRDLSKPNYKSDYEAGCHIFYWNEGSLKAVLDIEGTQPRKVPFKILLDLDDERVYWLLTQIFQHHSVCFPSGGTKPGQGGRWCRLTVHSENAPAMLDLARHNNPEKYPSGDRLLYLTRMMTSSSPN